MTKREIQNMIRLRKLGVANTVVLQTMIDLEPNKARLAAALDAYMEVICEQGHSRPVKKVEVREDKAGNQYPNQDQKD